MALVKFIFCTPEELDLTEYQSGALYFVFSDNSNQGHIFLDMNGVRKEISASFDDTDIQTRINKLESLVLIHCTGIDLANSFSFIAHNSYTIYANIYPADCTDDIICTIEDETVIELQSTAKVKDSTQYAININALTGGSTTLTISCGSYTATTSLDVTNSIIVEHKLVEDYSPAGASFIYTAPISLSGGNYIEALIDVSGVTTAKENLLSIGHNIDKGAVANSGARIGLYTSQTVGKIQQYIRFYCMRNNSTISNQEIQLSNDSTFLIKLDTSGL